MRGEQEKALAALADVGPGERGAAEDGEGRRPARGGRAGPAARTWRGAGGRGAGCAPAGRGTQRLESIFLRLTRSGGAGLRGGGIVKALLIARRELAGYLRTISGYVIIAVILALERAVLQRLRAGQGGGALRRGAVATSSTLERHHHRGLGVHLHAAAGRGAADGHVAAALLLAAAGREIVLGKYLAALAFLARVPGATLYMPLLIMVHGKVSAGPHRRGLPGAAAAGQRGAGDRDVRLGAGAQPDDGRHPHLGDAGGAHAVLDAGAHHRAAARERVQRAVALEPALPALPVGVVHLRDVVYYLVLTFVALFGPRGCSRRGGGDESPGKQSAERASPSRGVLVLGLIAERIAGAGGALIAMGMAPCRVLLLGLIAWGATRMARTEGRASQAAVALGACSATAWDWPRRLARLCRAPRRALPRRGSRSPSGRPRSGGRAGRAGSARGAPSSPRSRGSRWSRRSA